MNGPETPWTTDIGPEAGSRWVHNQVEWRRVRGTHQPYHPDTMPQWRIPYPIDGREGQPHIQDWHRWAWEHSLGHITALEEPSVYPAADADRDTYQYLTQWYPVYPPHMGRIADNAAARWSADTDLQNSNTGECGCHRLARHDHSLIDQAIGHVRSSSISNLLRAAERDPTVIGVP